MPVNVNAQPCYALGSGTRGLDSTDNTFRTWPKNGYWDGSTYVNGSFV